MAKVKNIERTHHWAKRPLDNNSYSNDVWYVEKGEDYDLVQFSIKELQKNYYWPLHLCVPCDWNEKKVRKVVNECAKGIKEEEIKDFCDFLEMGEKWGWD